MIFDKLLLLAAGGQTVFFGPTEDVNAYFEKHGSQEMPPGTNPGDWAIMAPTQVKDPVSIWNLSEEKKGLDKDLEVVLQEDVKPLTFDTYYAASFGTQFMETLKRANKMYWRDLHNLKARFYSTIALSLMVGILYLRLNAKYAHIPEKVSDKDEVFLSVELDKLLLLSFWFVCVVYASENAAEEVPTLQNERPMFYRELDSKLYGVLPYYISRNLASTPLSLIQAVVFGIPLYLMAFCAGPYGDSYGYNAELWPGLFFFLFCMYLIIHASVVFSTMHGALTPTESVGNVLFTTSCALSRLFSGFMIPLDLMGGSNGFSLFVRYFGRLCSTINMFKYAIFSMAAYHIPMAKKSNILSEGDLAVIESDPSPSPDIDEEWGYKILKTFVNVNTDPVVNEQLPEYQKDYGGWSEWQFLVGLLLVIFALHFITLMLLTFKRWSKR